MDLKERIKRSVTGGNTMVPISLRVPQADLKELDRICSGVGIKRQAAINDAIKDWIKDAQETLQKGANHAEG